jgi:hypothetical protein
MAAAPARLSAGRSGSARAPPRSPARLLLLLDPRRIGIGTIPASATAWRWLLARARRRLRHMMRNAPSRRAPSFPARRCALSTVLPTTAWSLNQGGVYRSFHPKIDAPWRCMWRCHRLRAQNWCE